MFALAAHASVPTLTIAHNGRISLSPPPPPPGIAELYSSPSLGGPWTFETEFTVATTNRPLESRFFRVRLKSPPLQLVQFLETNSTVRGLVTKGFSNVTVVDIAGHTNHGWSIGRTRGTNYEFSFAVISNAGPAILRFWDVDGFFLQTNIVIGPGKPVYEYRGPKRWMPGGWAPAPRRPGGAGGALAPAGVPPSHDYPLITAHRFQFDYSLTWRDGQGCKTLTQTSAGAAGDDDCTFTASLRRTCDKGPQIDCWCGYGMGGEGWTLAKFEESGTGGCFFPDFRSYPAAMEFSDYEDSGYSDPQVESDHISRTSSFEVMGWISERPSWAYRLRMWANIWKVGVRYGDEVEFEPVAYDCLISIGDIKATGDQVVCNPGNGGTWINVTPRAIPMLKGWYQCRLGWGWE